MAGSGTVGGDGRYAWFYILVCLVGGEMGVGVESYKVEFSGNEMVAEWLHCKNRVYRTQFGCVEKNALACAVASPGKPPGCVQFIEASKPHRGLTCQSFTSLER